MATGPGRSKAHRVPLLRVRRRAATVTFLAVLEPLAPDGASQVETLRTAPTDDGVRITVTHRSGVETVDVGAASIRGQADGRTVLANE